MISCSDGDNSGGSNRSGGGGGDSSSGGDSSGGGDSHDVDDRGSFGSGGGGSFCSPKYKLGRMFPMYCAYNCCIKILSCKQHKALC